MIITVTPNAALDKTIQVPSLQIGRRHRGASGFVAPGGKGINVARSLLLLQQPVIATGLAGGETGARIQRELDAEGILNDFVRIGDESRTSTAVVDGTGRLVGLFTDGDLRRNLERNADPRTTVIDSVMTRDPRAIRPNSLAVEAVEVMERRKSTQLPVVDAEGRLVGALNIHDLFQARIL